MGGQTGLDGGQTGLVVNGGQTGPRGGLTGFDLVVGLRAGDGYW